MVTFDGLLVNWGLRTRWCGCLSWVMAWSLPPWQKWNKTHLAYIRETLVWLTQVWEPYSSLHCMARWSGIYYDRWNWLTLMTKSFKNTWVMMDTVLAAATTAEETFTLRPSTLHLFFLRTWFKALEGQSEVIKWWNKKHVKGIESAVH